MPVLVLLTGLLWSEATYGIVGETSGNPYQGIVDRNVFALKPPPPPPSAESQQPPAPKIVITGITTILGNKRVLLKVAIPAKGTEPAREQSSILAEGQRDGDIEVMQIDEKTGDVKLNDYGTILTLNIEKDGPKLSATPMPTVAGGAANAAGAAAATHTGFPAAAGGKMGLPTRTLRTTPANAAAPIGMGANPGMAQGISAAGGYSAGLSPGMMASPVYSGTPAVPTVSLAPGVQSPQPGAMVNQAPGVAMTPEEQAILMEVERERNANNPNYAPLPPTPLTPGPPSPTGTRQVPALPPPPPMPPR